MLMQGIAGGGGGGKVPDNPLLTSLLAVNLP